MNNCLWLVPVFPREWRRFNSRESGNENGRESRAPGKREPGNENTTCGPIDCAIFTFVVTHYYWLVMGCLCCYLGCRFLLTARLYEIADRWTDGPLADEMKATDVKHMIRALFENNERRSATLAAIKWLPVMVQQRIPVLIHELSPPVIASLCGQHFYYI